MCRIHGLLTACSGTVRLTHSHSDVWGAGDDSGRHGNNLRSGISYCTLPLSNPTHIQATKGETVRERERERDGGREGEKKRENRENKPIIKTMPQLSQ